MAWRALRVALVTGSAAWPGPAAIDHRASGACALVKQVTEGRLTGTYTLSNAVTYRPERDAVCLSTLAWYSRLQRGDSRYALILRWRTDLSDSGGLH